MNDLQDLVETPPIDLNSMVPEGPSKPLPFPEASVKNRAALTSLLTDDPSKVPETYQAIINENNSGTDYTRSAIINKKVNEEKPKDISMIMSILADKNMPLKDKQSAIDSINSGWHKDTPVLVATNALEKPSKGENVEQEDVRMTGAEQFNSFFRYNQEKQAVMNQHMMTTEQSTANSLIDFVSFLQPFAANKYGVSTLKPILDELHQSMSTGVAAALPGEAMMKIKKIIENMPASDKEKVMYKLSDIIKNNSSLFLNSDNNFAEIAQLQAVMDGDYSQFDRAMDNISGVLDAIGLGEVMRAKRLTSLFTRTPKVEEAKVLQTAVTEGTKPGSAINILKEANPEKARSAYSLIVKSTDDEAAKALAGTDRAHAIADQKLPQAAKRDGSVASKIVDPDRDLRVINPDEGLLNIYNDASNMIFSADEWNRAKANIVNDLRNINGIVLHDNMLSVADTGGTGLKINAMLGNTEGGFLKGEWALDQARYAFREYGVTDANLQLMKKIDGEYVPITLAETKGKFGNYMVKIDVDHKVNPFDIGEMDKLDVKRNWLDRIPSLVSQKSGSASRHILDAASMLHPRLTTNAVVAVDRGTLIDKKLVEMFHNFAEKHQALDATRQAKVYDYLKEANLTGTELDDIQLAGRGFNNDEIDAIKSWRKAWDTHFWFENADAAKTLANQGYHVFENKNDKFFAKAVGKNQNIAHAYDPSTQSIVNLTKDQMDELYNKGGYYAQFRRPVNINGVNVEHMVVRNTPTEYLRAIKENDQILNYRPGYYQVQYKAPKFVTHTVRDASGNELYTKAIAVAGDSREAEHLRQRLAAANGYNLDDVKVRSDMGEMRVDTDHYWDMQNASGRTAQRHRGKRLETSTNPLTSFDSQYVVDPVESSIRASRSLSTRIAMRDHIETSKIRALQQYGKYFPENRFGQKMWVENASSLVPKEGTLYEKELADARTTVEYINYLQNGYSNSLDDHVKGLFNALATTAAKMDLPIAERGLLTIGSAKPTQFMKSGVFTSYLAMNPLRQFIVQGHQAIRLVGMNPKYAATGWFKDITAFARSKMGFTNFSKEEQAMIDFIDKSGMLQTVDRQNLLRGPLTDLVEAHNPIKKAFGKAIEIPRKIGFDLGEQSNIVHHLLFVRDKFLSEGKNLNNKAVRDEAYAYARALNYDMNFAGDMPYNQNWASMFLQFMQVPHKAITSMTTNRVISTADKMKLILTDSLLWGVPGATVLSNLIGKDQLPDDPKARELVLFGLESLALNHTLSKASGKDVKIDFSGFSPYNTEGFAQLFTAIATGGMADFAMNSPAMSLYFKNGSRMREALGKLGRYMGFIDTQEGLEVPDALAVLNSFAEAGSSGWSNYNKAKAILETGKIKNAKGGILAEDSNYMEAAARLFGFRTQQEILDFAALKAMNEGTKQHRDEVLQTYNTYIRLLSGEQKLTNDDPEWTIKVLGAMKNMYKNDPLAMQIIAGQLKKDLYNDDMKIIKGALEYSKIPDATNLTSINNLKTLDDEQKNKALKLMEELMKQAKEYGDK